MSRVSVDNPATGETAAEVELLGVDAVAALAMRARDASRDFATSTIRERAALCERVLESFADSGEAIAADVTRQMGKPISQSRAELATMIERARFMISIAEESLADEPLAPKPGFERSIERAPVGVVLDIAAWNYPLLIPVNVVVPAVLAGNAVIVKHSSRTPLCAAHFADAFAAAGAPRDLVVGIAADHGATAELVARPEVGYVAFTGSVDGGREVSRAAAGRAIDVGLELGGNDAAYVRRDADLDFAAENIAEGALYNAGQSCCAVERVYVERSVYERFLDAVAEAFRGWTPADPTDPASRLGPMAQPGAPVSVAAQVVDAVAKGARTLVEGGPTDVEGAGRYYAPTVLADTTHDMTIMVEETFGPVLPVAPVDGDDQAVRLMNDSRYGLTASVWTRDVEAARRIGRRLEVGTVFMNRCDYLDPALPWSGWKDSGVGVTLSRLGFDRMVRTRGYHFRLQPVT